MEKKIILFMALGIILGFSIAQIYNINFTNAGRKLEGYYIRNSYEPEFNYGDWVCINVEDMSYERAIEVCQHEVGHEIFAEICEKNISKCFEVAENEK